MPFLRLPHTPVNRLLSSFACSSNLPSALATQPQLPKSAQYRLYSGQFDTSQGVATKENGTLGSPTEVKRVGFGFSAGGLVFPYLVGVAEGLREGGLLTSEFCWWIPWLNGLMVGNELGTWKVHMTREMGLLGYVDCIQNVN